MLGRFGFTPLGCDAICCLCNILLTLLFNILLLMMRLHLLFL
jgi:hypothetical protein